MFSGDFSFFPYEEFYIQKCDRVMEKKYQYGEGRLSDQALGQWLAMAAASVKLQFAKDGCAVIVRSRKPLTVKAGQELSVETEF